MNEHIDKIVELDIDDERLDDELFEDTGVDIISLVDAPAIEVGFLSFNKETFVKPTSNESEDDFIGRCMGELENEYPDEQQRLAVCYSYYEGDYKGGCEGACDTELILGEEQQNALLEFCEDDNNGQYITEDDLVIDLSKNEFAGIKDVISAIRSLDILKRLTIKRKEKPETYWRYMGPPPQRDFCKAMMRLSKSGKIFSQIEIEKMRGINSQFAKKGKSSYSIFEWQGGKNCKHWWEKLQIFKAEDGTKVVIAGGPIGRKQKNATQPWNAKMSFAIDEEKRIVMGPVMIPNKMILRRDETGEPFYIYFTKKTIRKMAEKFFKLNKHNNTDINHDENITTENTLMESWISESFKHDKSYKYGFALPEGTWYVSYKINNDDTWNKIKSGDLKGFSLSGGFIQKMKPVDNNKTLNDIKNILNDVDE